MSLDLNAFGATAVDIAFKQAESLLRSCIYTKRTAGIYTPSTGTVTQSETTAAVLPFFGNFNVKEIDGSEILFGDTKILIKVSELTGDLSRDDFLVETASSFRWDVRDYMLDSTGNLWIIQGRRDKA